MGILNRLFGTNSSSDTDSGAVGVTQYYFIGNEIQKNPLEEAMVILSHHPKSEDWKSAEDWRWSVVKCNEPINVGRDMEVQVCVYREGSVIVARDTYQSHYAWLLSSEEINALENDESIVRTFPFPDVLRETTIPAGTRWSMDDLQSLLLPLSI